MTMAGTASSTSPRHACIVGAGIVGCATAYALARRGWRVTLVDAAVQPAQGASLANGAQLSYSYVEPLATPQALRSLPMWLLSRDSPVRWRPSADAAHWRWLASFVAACRPAVVQQTTQALLALSFLSRDSLHTWFDEVPGMAAASQHARPGKLVIHRDAAARAAARQQLTAQAAFGCRQRIVGADECVTIEPALAGAAARIAFGVWTDSEEVVDTALLAQALARASGAALRLGTRVTGFDMRQGAARAVRLASGDEIEADHFVVAGGAASVDLLRGLGVRLPIEPIKGYSITVPVTDAAAAPRVSVTDIARKVVHARLGDRLRVAGFAELVGDDTSIDSQRIDALRAAVDDTFPQACDTARPETWAGLRPATPSGRPLIGAGPCPNLWVNAGHGALGLTLAAGSATLLSRWMNGEAPGIDPSPYRLRA
jgi:D-amino-acid dehydrogenase